MDDEIMRKMGGDKIQAVARMMMSKEQLESMTFTQKQFTSSIQRAQKQMEGRHFSSRKHLFDYDSVINKQRERIYAKRDNILEKQRDMDEEVLLPGENYGVVELNVYDEIQASIDDVASNLVTTYTSFKPWNITELVEEMSQITGATFLEDDYAGIGNAKVMKEKVIKDMHDLFVAKFADVEDAKKLDMCRRIYLYVLDKNRQQHIDEMQYLREKVGLYGYAQLDPLVIYKKEAYDKFQRLLAQLKVETLANVFRVDVNTFGTGAARPEAPKKVNMMDVLKAVTQWLKAQSVAKPVKTSEETVVLGDGEKATVLEEDDGIEILEVVDDVSTSSDSPIAGVDTSRVKKKLRPNDKVTIRYADGRVEQDIKWKKVKSIVEAGEAEVV